ncbi:MAG: potassium-transporting ATPase subunit KdpA [Candidatus Thermoplasmatota archaeon]|nr:potassium-transporting ATPase subunit KdpA [Candidatus Thermoplasmatota archaeon]
MSNVQLLTLSSGTSSFWGNFFLQNRVVSGAIIILIYILVMSLMAFLLSGYIKKLYLGEPNFLDPISGRLVSFFEKMFGESKEKTMKFREYFLNLLLFNAAAAIMTFLVLYFQNLLPFSAGYSHFSLSLTFNTVTSFLTNTNLQHYSNPMQLTYFSQTFVITGLMFVGAGTGFAASMAFIRGIIQDKGFLGNFYHDFLVSIFYLLLPLSLGLTLILLIFGVPETLSSSMVVHILGSHGTTTIPLGPVATLEGIKNIGTNGGGFYGANAGFPFENPNWFTNLSEFVGFTLIPLASIFSLGKVFNNKGFSNMLFGVVIAIFIFTTFMTYFGEYAGIPALSSLGTLYTGNMLGKETALGISQSSIFATGAVFTSTGAGNSVLLAFTPVGILGVMGNLLLNDPIGGVGVGIMNLFMFVIFTTFITSLMVGKLPELMSLKLSSREIKYSTLSLATHPLLVLIPFGVTMLLPGLIAGFPGTRPDAITSVLYEFGSAAANNGSEMGGFLTNQAYFNYLDGIVMLLGRFLLIGFQLVIAESFSNKSPKVEFGRSINPSSLLYGLMLFTVMILLGVLSFFPILALGPFLSWAHDFSLYIGGAIL